MTEYSGFQIGAFVSPLTAATTNSLLQDADPALFAALNYFQAVLQVHLGARFDAEVTKAGLASLAGKVSSLAIPYDPMPHLQQAQLEPPFLALYTPRERPTEKTRNWYHVEADMKLLWCLPPLSPAQYLQLYPMLRAVAKVVLDRNEQGHDPAYLSDARFCQLGGIEAIAIIETRYGTIQGPRTELFFPCVEMDLQVFERRMTAPGVGPLVGFDGTVSSTDPQGANPLALANFQEALT